MTLTGQWGDCSFQGSFISTITINTYAIKFIDSLFSSCPNHNIKLLNYKEVTQ